MDDHIPDSMLHFRVTFIIEGIFRRFHVLWRYSNHRCVTVQLPREERANLGTWDADPLEGLTSSGQKAVEGF